MMDMHELSVTQSILDIALKNPGTRKVKQINLVIGQFSSIVDDSSSFIGSSSQRILLQKVRCFILNGSQVR